LPTICGTEATAVDELDAIYSFGVSLCLRLFAEIDPPTKKKKLSLVRRAVTKIAKKKTPCRQEGSNKQNQSQQEVTIKHHRLHRAKVEQCCEMVWKVDLL
jgi:hypothetical protein